MLTWGLALGVLGSWGTLAPGAFQFSSAALVKVGLLVALLAGATVAITVLRPAWWSSRAHRRVMLPLCLTLGAPIVGLSALFCVEYEPMFRAGARMDAPGPSLVALSLGLTAVVLYFIHRQRHQRHFGGLLWLLARGAMGALAVLALVGTAKKIARSSPDLDQLPHRVVFAPSTDEVGTPVVHPKGSPEVLLELRHDWAEVGSEAEPLSLHRVCSKSACRFAFRRVPTGTEPYSLGLGAITMTSDEREGLFYLSDGEHTLVFLAQNLQPLPGGVAQSSGRFTAPWSWLVGAGASLGLILVLQAFRRRAEAWAEVLAGASAGRVEDGWVRFRDQRPDEQAPAGLPSGSRVIVLPGEHPHTDDYRSSHSLPEGDVLKGHQGLLLDKAWSNVAALDALSVSLAALAAAPLLVGLALGLLF